MKYHIDKNGKPALCRATVRNCPLGGEESHFDTVEEAQSYADEVNKDKFGLMSELKSTDFDTNLNRKHVIDKIADEHNYLVNKENQTESDMRRIAQLRSQVKRLKQHYTPYIKTASGYNYEIKDPSYVARFEEVDGKAFMFSSLDYSITLKSTLGEIQAGKDLTKTFASKKELDLYIDEKEQEAAILEYKLPKDIVARNEQLEVNESDFFPYSNGVAVGCGDLGVVKTFPIDDTTPISKIAKEAIPENLDLLSLDRDSSEYNKLSENNRRVEYNIVGNELSEERKEKIDKAIKREVENKLIELVATKDYHTGDSHNKVKYEDLTHRQRGLARWALKKANEELPLGTKFGLVLDEASFKYDNI